MQERKRIIYIILVMAAFVVCIGVISNILLYRTYFNVTRDHLVDTVKILAQLIGAQSELKNGAFTTALTEKNYNQFSGEIIQAIKIYERLNRKTELTVAYRDGLTINFIVALRYNGHVKQPMSVGFNSGLAEPMRRALEGRSGTMVGKDYHGTPVLAAYEPVPGFNLGVVAKITMADIRAPFVRTGIIILSVSILIIILGIIAVSRIGRPIITSLEQNAGDLAAANEELGRTNEELTAANEELDASNEELQAAMDEMERTNENLIHSQEELIRSESRVRTLLDSSPVGIITADLENRRFVYANPSACAMFGYTCDEMLTIGVDDIHPANELQKVHAEFQSLVNMEYTISRDLPCKKKDGTLFCADISATPINFDGRPCILGQFMDVTDRKKALESLKESEEKFAKAFMNAPVLMSISRIEDGTIIDVNEQFVSQSGFSRDELIGKSIVGIGYVRPDDRIPYRDKVGHDSIITDMELTVYPKMGAPRTVIYCGESVTIGGVKRLLSIAVDITEKKQAEEALKRQKEMAQKYLDIAGVMFVVIGADHTVSLINRRGCEILGYSADHIVGADWFEFIPERVREDVRNVFNQIMSGERTSAEYFENSVLTASGEERLIAWHNALLKDASGVITGSLSSGEDITERKKNEDDLHNQLALNMALAGISGSVISRSFSVSETAYMVLEYARILSDSMDGCVSEIDPETGDNIAHALTKESDVWPVTGNEGTVILRKGGDGLYPGLLGHALNTMRDFFTNDPKKHPVLKPDHKVQERVVRFLSVPVLFGGTLVGQIALANPSRDYTEEDLKMARRLGSLYALAIVRFRDETMLIKSLDEKTMLIKELHHRVKNNMQVVSSLISLQAQKIDDTTYRSLFMESSNRIQAMAMVHEKMYHSGDVARIDFSRYVREIAERLLYSFSLEPGHVELEVDVRDIFLGIDEAVPCGIIMNELITNAFKHAFRDGRRGKLSISFMKNMDGKRRLVVHDDGPGISRDLADSADKSLGMQIVTALTRQLDGTISIDGTSGTRVELLF